MEVVHQAVSRSLDFVAGLGRSGQRVKDHRPFLVLPGHAHVGGGTGLRLRGLHEKKSHNGQNDTDDQGHFTALGKFFGYIGFSHWV
jgi:hypothetical protein